eukprot:scaffold1970_cov396-Prasinococcus_capsulatus_cf.AAC.29
MMPPSGPGPQLHGAHAAAAGGEGAEEAKARMDSTAPSRMLNREPCATARRLMPTPSHPHGLPAASPGARPTLIITKRRKDPKTP